MGSDGIWDWVESGIGWNPGIEWDRTEVIVICDFLARILEVLGRLVVLGYSRWAVNEWCWQEVTSSVIHIVRSCMAQSNESALLDPDGGNPSLNFTTGSLIR